MAYTHKEVLGQNRSKAHTAKVIEQARTTGHAARQAAAVQAHQEKVQDTAAAQSERYAQQIDARNAQNNKDAIKQFATPAKGSSAKGISTGGGILRIGILGLVLIVVYVAVTAGNPQGSNATGVLGSIGTWLSSLASTSPLFTETKTGSTTKSRRSQTRTGQTSTATNVGAGVAAASSPTELGNAAALGGYNIGVATGEAIAKGSTTAATQGPFDLALWLKQNFGI